MLSECSLFSSYQGGLWNIAIKRTSTGICLNLSFVKDINVAGGKITRNGHKMVLYFSFPTSLQSYAALPRYHCSSILRVGNHNMRKTTMMVSFSFPFFFQISNLNNRLSNFILYFFPGYHHFASRCNWNCKDILQPAYIRQNQQCY